MDPTKDRPKVGWIHSAGGLGGSPLDKILPELKFIEGCAGYLRQRVADADHAQQLAGSPVLAVSQLNAFVQSNESQPADLTNAVAIQLAGMVEYLSGRDQVEALTMAADDFERARKIIPYDPNAITLTVGAQVAEEWRKKRRLEQTALKAKRLSAASALSSDKASLVNLNSLYMLLMKNPQSVQAPDDLTRDAVTEKIEALKHLAVPK
jgi:hypothetical protein